MKIREMPNYSTCLGKCSFSCSQNQPIKSRGEALPHWKECGIVLEISFDSGIYYHLYIYESRPFGYDFIPSPTGIKCKPARGQRTLLSHNANCLNQYPATLNNKDIIPIRSRVWDTDWWHSKDPSLTVEMAELRGTSSNPAFGMWRVCFNARWNKSKTLPLSAAALLPVLLFLLQGSNFMVYCSPSNWPPSTFFFCTKLHLLLQRRENYAFFL